VPGFLRTHPPALLLGQVLPLLLLLPLPPPLLVVLLLPSLPKSD
jgi:hypothetical protein